LAYVLSDFASDVYAQVHEQEWREDDKGRVNVLSTFLTHHGGTPQQPPEQWHRAKKVSPPKDPSFAQVSSFTTYGPTAPGYEQVCPRDGKLHCSIVDAVRKSGHSAKATQFLSWAWGYGLSVPLGAMQEYLRQNPSQNPFIWWCFFCNNQFRILENDEVQSTKDLAHMFGDNLKQVGKMWMLMDNLQESMYTSRIWCIFEVFIARKWDIPCSILTPHSRITFDVLSGSSTLTDLQKICEVRAEDATASYKQDEDGIKALIIEEFGSFEAVNSVVQFQLAATWTKFVWQPDKISQKTVWDQPLTLLTSDAGSHGKGHRTEIPTTPDETIVSIGV